MSLSLHGEEINGQRYRLTDGDYVEPTAGMRPTIIVSNTTLKVDDKESQSKLHLKISLFKTIF